jgi:hypothetical protein
MMDVLSIENDNTREEPFSFRLKEWTSCLRYKPSFLIIGAQKAGTTSLYEYLQMTQRVLPVYHKEVHYFDIFAERSDAWYRAHFPLRRPGHFMVGDATPYYLFHPLAPARAAKRYPKLKLICLLRNPVDRAFSHYNHNCRKGREDRSFEAAIEDERVWIDAETQKLKDDPAAYSVAHRHFSYLSRGLYVDQIKRWHDAFGKEALLLLSSEEFYTDTKASVGKACAFLGIEPLQENAFDAKNKYDYTSTLDAKTRTWLEAFYAPANHDLYAYLGRDFGW